MVEKKREMKTEQSNNIHNKSNNPFFYGYADDSSRVHKQHKKNLDLKNGARDNIGYRDRRVSTRKPPARHVSSQEIALRRRAVCSLFGPCLAVIVLLVVLQTASFIFLHYQMDVAEKRCYTQQEKLHLQLAKLMEEFRGLKTETAFLKSIQGVRLLHHQQKLNVDDDDEEYDQNMSASGHGQDEEEHFRNPMDIIDIGNNLKAKINAVDDVHKKSSKHDILIKNVSEESLTDVISGDGGQWNDNEDLDPYQYHFKFKDTHFILDKLIVEDSVIKHNLLGNDLKKHSKDDPRLNEVLLSNEGQGISHHDKKLSKKTLHHIRKRARRSLLASQGYRSRSVRDHRLQSDSRYFTPSSDQYYGFDGSKNWNNGVYANEGYVQERNNRPGRKVRRDHDIPVGRHYTTQIQREFNSNDQRRNYNSIGNNEYNAAAVEYHQPVIRGHSLGVGTKYDGNAGMPQLRNFNAVRNLNSGSHNVYTTYPASYVSPQQPKYDSHRFGDQVLQQQGSVGLTSPLHRDPPKGIDTVSQQSRSDQSTLEEAADEGLVKLEDESGDGADDAEKSWLQLTSYAKIPVSTQSHTLRYQKVRNVIRLDTSKYATSYAKIPVSKQSHMIRYQ